MKSLQELHYSDVSQAQLNALLRRGRRLRAEMLASLLHAPRREHHVAAMPHGAAPV